MGTSNTLWKIFPLFIILVNLMEGIGAEFIGCYKENSRQRIFAVSPGGYSTDTLTPNICAKNCAFYNYDHLAIVQGTYCFCANSPVYIGPPDDSQCTVQCVDGSQCGGTDYVSVYKVGGLITDLNLAVSKQVVPVAESISLIIGLTSELDVEYQFDYGDGAGFTTKNGSDIYTKSFYTPGEYEVVVLATDAAGSGQTAEEVKLLNPKQLNIALRKHGIACSGKREHKIRLLCDVLSIDVDKSNFQQVLTNVRNTKQGWTKDLRNCPPVSLPEVTDYLLRCHDTIIHTKSGNIESFTAQNLKRYKTLRSYDLYRSGHVHSIRFQPMSNTNYCALQGKCNPSWDTSGTVYDCLIILKHNGQPIGSSCTCTAGLGEACTHVAGILFAMEDFTSLGYHTLPEDPAITELLCTWNSPKTPKEMRATTAVIVDEPVGQIEFLCPESGVTFTEIECNATVSTGTTMAASVAFGDGNIENFTIADPGKYLTGPGIPEKGTIPAGVSGTIIMPASEFKDNGIITAFEFRATATTSITILVLKPICAGCYSFQDNMCKPNPGDCADADLYQCASADFCPSSGTCSSSCSPPGRYSPQVLDYEVVETIQYANPAVGYNYKTSPIEVAVEKGYILGAVTGGNIGFVTSETGEEDFIYSGGANKGDSLTTFTTTGNKRHLVRAITSQPLLIRVRHTYQVNGKFDLTLNVYNSRIDGMATAQTNITIGDGIDHVPLETEECFKTLDTVTVNILPHEGDDVKYSWDWGDGTIESDRTASSNSHVYSAPNVYNVTVTAKNLLSEKQNYTEVCVQDEIQNPKATSSPSATGASVDFTFTLSSGSDYTCNWTTDGSSFQTDSISKPTNSLVQYTYTSPARYSVDLICFNKISQASYTFGHDVEDVITGLTLINKAAKKGEDFQLEWSIASGTNPTFNVTIGTRNPPVDSFDPVSGIGGTIMISNIDDTGIVEVKIDALNQVSQMDITENFRIEVEIRDVTFNCSQMEVLQGDFVTFTVTIEDGTGVYGIWDFDDAGITHDFSFASGVAWPANHIETHQHAFTTGGRKNVSLQLSNGVSSVHRECQIDVIAELDTIIIVTNSPVTFEPPGVMEMYFDQVNGSAPAGATVLIEFGDGFTMEDSFSLHKVYKHEYVANGTYNIRGFISNSAGSAIATSRVEIVEPIVQFRVVTDPEHAVIGQQITVKAIMFRGCDSGATLFWDFGDSDTADTPESGSCPDGITSVTHIYNNEQSYTIKVRAENSLGNTTADYVIYSQHPVKKENFEITITGPKTWTVPFVDKGFEIGRLNGAVLPSDASVVLDYGDDNQDTIDLIGPFPMSLSHRYTVPGNYKAKIIIQNLASSAQYDLEVEVLEPITGSNLAIVHKPAIPLNSPVRAGFGTANDNFPLDRPVIFNVTSLTGTIQEYKLTATSPSKSYPVKTFTSSPFEFTFDTVEDYDISIQVSNFIGQETVTGRVIMKESCLGLSITDRGIITASSEEKLFYISTISQGSESCLVIDYGDGSDLEAFGDSILCDPLPTGQTATYVGPFPTEIRHKYWTIGTFTITVTASNLLSTDTASLTFPVSYVACRSPAISMEERAPEFDKPRTVKRSQIFRVIGTTDLNCTKTLNNIKRWQVWLVDDNDGTVISEIDVTSLESSKKAELAVPARFLEYGLYKIRYTVDMDGVEIPANEKFSGFADTYVKVEKTPLIANLIEGGMSTVTLEKGSIITLNPGSYSIDPDIKEGEPQVFDSYVWFCMKIGDRGYPTLTDGSYNTSFATIPLTDPTLYTEDRGGCFRAGPGPIGFTAKTISVHTNQFDVDKSYEFMVIVSKDSREATAKLVVHVVDKPVPSIVIECKTEDLCRTVEGGQQVNPSARLALKGRCKGPCTGELTFKWEGYYYDYRWPFKPIADFEQYTSGTGSPEIAISTSLFSEFSGVSKFRIDLTVQEDGGEAGKSQIVLFVNKPPSGGSCTLTGSTGTILTSGYATLDCSGWTDPDGVESYQFYVKFKDEQMERHLVFGKENSVRVQLPLGPDWDDFGMDVNVRIYDSQSAFTFLNFDHVQVKPSVTENVDTFVGGLLSGSDDRISVTVARAHLLESCYTFQSIGSALNSAKYTEATVSAQQTPTGYGPGGVPKSHQDSVSQEDEERARQEKDDRAQLREQMIAGIQKVTTSTVASVALKASTVTTLGYYPDELTRQAQEDMMTVLVDCASSLSHLSEVTTKEELVGAATNIMAGVGVLLVASKYHYDDPLPSDLAESKLLDFYDTNLESDDEVIESLDPTEGRSQLTMGTNRKKQKETADNVVDHVIDGVKKVSSAIRQYLVPGEDGVEIITDQLALNLQKDRASDLANRTVQYKGGSVDFPDWCSLQAEPDCSSNEIINLEIISSPSVPYGLTENAANLTFSSAIEINFIREDGSHIGITDSQENIRIIIPRDQATDKGVPLEAEPVLPSRRVWEYLYFHRSEIQAENSSIHVQFRPNDTSIQYLVFIRLNDFPNVTKGEWDFVQQIPRSMAEAGTYGNASFSDPYTMFVPNDKIPVGWKGTFYVGVRQLMPGEYDTYAPNSNVTTDNWKGGENIFTSNYTMKIYTPSCLYYNTQVNDWRSDGCNVGELTSFTQTECFCNHLTTFAGGLIVAPNTIDWAYVFSNAGFLDNPTLYVTEMVVGVIYILAMIWARRQDKKDLQQVGITPLPDNEAQDKYYYEIVVQTGLRSNAGTDSKVHFILSGEYEETDVRALDDPKRKILRRGSTDGFLLAVPRPLGPLNFVRIWHDNSGKGKFGSWYMKYFLVRDLQTGEKFYFICNRWFAVEEDDGQVDRVCPVAGPEQMMQFGHQFSQKTRRNLSDGHLWFSVVARPPRSRFTRVQRVSCCLALLFLTMMANAMFYLRDEESGNANSFTFGPFALTPAQLYIGVVSNLIVFPVSFIIISLFRRSRPRKKRPSRIKEAIRQSGVKLSDINPEMGSKWSLKPDQQLNLPDRDNPDYRDDPTPRPDTAVSTISNFRSDTSMSGKMTNSYYNMQKKKRDKAKAKRMLPWWFQIIAWILLFLSVAVSVTITTFYGIQFGDYKCKQWITSMLIAFITSIFITQPIKVFLTAVILSLIIRNPGEDDEEGDEDEEDPSLGTDEEYLHNPHVIEGYGRPKKVAYKPPDPSALEKARTLRLKEIKMWNVIREIVFYAFFLWILMVISYGNRDPNSYLYKFSLERNFIGNNVTSYDFRQVHNTKNFWNWTVRSLVPSIRADNYYNGDPPMYLRGFINDKVSRIMGFATMRQLRIAKGTCRMEDAFSGIIESCNGNYVLWNEEKESYKAGWEERNETDPPPDTNSHYTYRSASSLNGYPYWGRLAVYGGGGYVVQMRESLPDLINKMNQLESEAWIDKYTRAVFVEFTVYNPGVNLFAVATLLAEWHPSAGVVASYRFEPVRLFSYMESAVLFQIACEVAFVLFIVFFIYREVRSVIKEKGKYLHNFWNMVEMSIIGVSIASVVIYFYRLIVTKQLTSVFEESHGNDYIKFQYVGYWNEILSYMIGWLVFLATLKFLKLLRFNRRMSLLAATLKNGWKSMFHFGLVFTIVFLAFIQLFYLVYHTNIYTFANFVNSMEAGFLMMMGKFDIYSMMMMEPIITPVFFFLFVVTITFVLVNMFVSILNESFTNVKHDVAKQPNEYEIVDFMLGRFKQWTGLGGAPPPTTKNPDMALNNLSSGGNGKAPVDHFPDKVDELLNTISKAYFDQDNLENVLGPKTDADRMAMKNLLKKHAETTQNIVNRDDTNNVDNSGHYKRF